MVSMSTTGWVRTSRSRFQPAPEMSRQTVLRPHQIIPQARGALGMSGRQHQEQGRVGAQKLLVGGQHYFLFAGMGGGGQPDRLAPGSCLAAVQQPLKLGCLFVIAVLEQAVTFKVAAEPHFGRVQAHCQQALTIQGCPGNNKVVIIN